MADWPMAAAIRTIRQGLSARAGLAAYRAGGGKIGDRTWFRAVGEARAAVAARGSELAAPLNRRPTSSEMKQFSTRGATGVLQQIEVFARDRSTGEIITIPYSVRSQTGVSRQVAIDEALSTITPEGTDGDTQVILGAAHVGAFNLVPGGAD